MKQLVRLRRPARLSAFLGLLAALGLAGCATLTPADGPAARGPAADPLPPNVAGKAPAARPGSESSAPSDAARPATAPKSVPASGLKPFADVVKGAERIDGLFTLWRKDDKIWLELKPSDLDRPLFLSPKLKTGIGEARVFGGSMGREAVVSFRRIHNQIQLIERNTEFFAHADTPEGRAVRAAFSPSLLGSTSVLSQPHPESKAILIEANPLFVSDMLGMAARLQRSYRQGYGLDVRNSAILDVRASKDLVVIEVQNHYATGSISTGSASGSGPGPSAPRALPDARSLFLTLHYSIARLPEQPMAPRRADARIGHFTTSRVDFSDDLARSPRQRFVNRWRLEKKDPSAELSEPVKPITFWIDRTIPLKYRPAITAGILEWNKAFERIGFKDAIRAEVQPDDAAFDTLDFGRASVRWMTNASPAYGAIGPSHVDPRSGEILDADIAFESLTSRALRALRSQILTAAAPDAGDGHAHDREDLAACHYAEQAAEQFAYALDVLEARGAFEPDGPQAEGFVEAYIKDTTMHEVGHALGLRHNFRASRVYSEAQLSDPAFTAAHGITGSVMEYASINLPAPGQPREAPGTLFNTTLGPYDYWAIEYAYKPLPAGSSAEQVREALSRIAARNAEPLLAYGTDEDNYLGIDPETLQFDLGSDPIAFARKRLAIARDLLARQEQRRLNPDEDYSVLRRSVTYAVRDMGRAAGTLARQIGGVRTVRDHPGSGRDPLMPVPAAQQREALDLLAAGFLSADSVQVSPQLQRKLAIDYQERSDAVFAGAAASSTDYSVSTEMLDVQRSVLGQLMSDEVAARLLDSESKLPGEALRLSELYERIRKSVWSELAERGDIVPIRRELQREHINRLAALTVRPAASSRADARSLLRAEAQALLAAIKAVRSRPGLSAEARAHLDDSAETLAQALAARLVRASL